jgi:hypothetical protein
VSFYFPLYCLSLSFFSLLCVVFFSLAGVMGVASQYGNMSTSSNGGGGSIKASARRRGRSLSEGKGKGGDTLKCG